MIRKVTALVAMISATTAAMAAGPDQVFRPVSYTGTQSYMAGIRYGSPAGSCTNGTCQADACNTCCECPCPTWGPCACSNWYGGGEAVYLKRNRPSNQTLSILDDVDAVVLDTDDLDFDYELGYRVMVGHRYNECTALEVSYMSLQDWDANGQAGTPDINDPQLDPYWGSQVDLPTDSFDDSVLHDADYESSLRDIEINGRHFISCNTSLLFGFRYIHLDESFDFTSIDNVGGSRYGQYNIDTNNDLFGLQIGLARQWCCGCKYSFGAYGKAGLFYNNVDSDQHLVNVTSSGLDRDERASKNDNAFSTIIDLGLRGTYCINDHVRLNAGYMFVVINNVALAPEQLSDAPNQIALTAGSLNDNGSLIYQGPTAGLDICW